MRVFFDTSAFIAYFVKQQFSHEETVEKYNFYRGQKATFFTSNYILDELFTWFVVRQNKAILEKVINALERVEKSGELEVFYIDSLVEKKALETLLKFAEHKLSFTDITSYILYKEFGLDEVFTLDADFKKIGVKTSF